MRFRLSLLLFLVYAPPGAMWPTFPRHLDALGFSPLQIALVCATAALATVIGPLVAGQVADRWLAPERCLAVCGFAGAGVFLLLPGCTTAGGVFLGSLSVWLLMVPAMTLGSAVSFAHLQQPERDFGRVRMWGTVGWMAQGWVLGYILSRPDWLHLLLMHLRPDAPQPVLADSFHVAAGFDFLLGCYALTIPPTAPRRDSPDRVAPLEALRLLRKPHFAVFFLCNFLLCLTIPFGSQNTPLLLKELGIGEEWTGPALTTAQTTEVLTLALLPWLLERLGLRAVLLLGAAAWAASLSVQTLGAPAVLVITCLSLNGLYISCYLVAGQVCVNSEAGPDFRASAQALISFSGGVGQLLGYFLSGMVRHVAGGAFGPTFAVAMLLAWLAVAILFTGWRSPSESEPEG